MSSLRLQWRGALVVLAAWAGLAVAQAQQLPAPSSSTVKSGVPERIVTVTENGKTIRCRLVETWQLADGTTAHKLQAVESGEFITILDDPSAAPTTGKAMTKRIFHWGLKSRTPPPGVPDRSVPPELMVDSGIVRTQEINRPASNVPIASGVVVGSSSPYSVGGAGGSVGSPSPYRVGEAGVVVGTSQSSMPLADRSISSGMQPCTPDCQGNTVVSDSPSLRDRIGNWFAGRSSTGEPKQVVLSNETKVAAPALPKPQEKVLAISGPPSSAQPARPEVVTAVTKSDVAKDWNKSAIGATLPGASKPGTDLAAAKPDVMTTPEKFTPSESRLKAKGIATAQDQQSTPELGGLPPGAASILAARSGLDGPIVYVPVQAAVVPQPWRAPVPPDPKTPEAPQLNAFVNAFSPPAQPKGANAPQMYGPGPQAMPYPPMMANGYPPQGMMPPYAMMNPYAMPPQAMMNPYMMQQGYPYGYPVMQTGYPMMPMQQPAPSPRQYQGPQAPNPFGAAPMGMQQVAYTQPMAPFAQPMMMPGPLPQMAAPQWGQLIDKLRDSPYPAEREQAAYMMTSCDWRTNPQVAKALVQAASQDPAPMVRAGCVVTLMRMNVATQSVMSVMQTLRTDADPRVRDAAEQAIVRLGQGTSTAKAN